MPVINIENNSVGYYQANTCEFNLIQILKINFLNTNFEIIPDKSSEVECHGKINGMDRVDGGKIKLYVGTNILIDFAIQSFICILFIILIPKNIKTYKFKFKYFNIFIILLVLYFHIDSENNFYNYFAKEFNTKLELSNFFLLTFIGFAFLNLIILFEILESRAESLINYFPYLFLIIGAYNSLNFNFFLIVFIIFGINSLFNKRYFNYFNILYSLMFLLVFFNNLNSDYESYFFDVDKLKGFVNSSNSLNSIIVWSIIYFLIILGFLDLFKEYKTSIDFSLLNNNFLISGSLITTLGILSSLFPILNFYSYYYLGLNKTGISTLTSKEGNTWRGLSSSAESLGEFYGFIFLFTFLLVFLNKRKLDKFTLTLLFINAYGFYRVNNVAALLSLLLIIGLFLINEKLRIIKQLRYTIYVILIIIILLISLNNSYSTDYLSKSLLSFGLENSQITYEFPKDQNGKSAVELLNFAEILKIDRDKLNISSSLYYFLDIYNNDKNINNLPSFITLTGAVAVTINRSEKWGIFLAKYNPDLMEVLFGYGPNQLVNYYHGHATKINDGLVLPHSSFLILLISFGLFGMIIFILYLISQIVKYYNNKFYLYLITFLILNLFKSDSVLYLNSFILIIFTLSISKKVIYEEKQ